MWATEATRREEIEHLGREGVVLLGRFEEPERGGIVVLFLLADLLHRRWGCRGRRVPEARASGAGRPQDEAAGAGDGAARREGGGRAAAGEGKRRESPWVAMGIGSAPPAMEEGVIYCCDGRDEILAHSNEWPIGLKIYNLARNKCILAPLSFAPNWITSLNHTTWYSASPIFKNWYKLTPLWFGKRFSLTW